MPCLGRLEDVLFKCVNGISLLCNIQITKSHSMKFLWMRLCDLYFCTIPVCVCVCVWLSVCVWGHASDACFIFYSQILLMLCLSFCEPRQPLIVLAHGFSIGHRVALVFLSLLFSFFCLEHDFVFSFYLNVTARWCAKTNLCPSLWDFCERCIKCFSSFVHPHSSFRQKTTVWVVPRLQQTECLYPSVVLT